MSRCLVDFRRQWRGKTKKRGGGDLTDGRWGRCPEYELCCSGWERAVCKALATRGIRHSHHPKSYPLVLEDGREGTYTPDIEAARVIIEPHSIPDMAFLSKMAAFREQYPEKKVILLTLNDAIPQFPEGIFYERLPIEYCAAASPSGDLLALTLKRALNEKRGACIA